MAWPRIPEDEALRIARRCHLDPIEPYPHSTMKKWRCRCMKCGREVAPTLNKLKMRGHQCRYCAGNFIGEPEAVLEVTQAGFQPLERYPGANRPWTCRCNRCKRSVPVTLSRLRQGATLCKYCAGRAVMPAEAEAVLKARGYLPLEPYPGTRKPWLSKCRACGNSVEFTYHSAVSHEVVDCPWCVAINAERGIGAFGLKPLEPFKSLSAPWHCRCLTCGRVVRPRWRDLLSGERRGCAYCSGKRVDQADVQRLLREKHLVPLDPYPGANARWRCRCLRCGQQIWPTYTAIRSNLEGCIYCARRKTDPADAETKMRESGLEPLVPYPGAAKGWKCRCLTCGRTVFPHYSSIQQGGGSCRFCSKGGIDYTAPGFLYIVVNEDLGAVKLGIANEPTTRHDRLRLHERRGWEVSYLLSFAQADDAFAIEQQVLNWIRVERHLPPFLKPHQTPQGGWTETVQLSRLSALAIWRKVLLEARRAGWQVATD